MPLRKQFDIGMNEIDHKIVIDVKMVCQVTISPILQHMLGIKRAIFPHGYFVADWVEDMTRGLNYLYMYCQLVKLRMVGEALVLLLRIGRRERCIYGDPSFRSRAVLCPGMFSDREHRYIRDDVGEMIE